MANEYEVTYLLRPNLEEAEADQRAAAISQSLTSNGGEVLNVEKLGKKRLAYEMHDVREGIYVIMRFRSETSAAKELERQLGLNEDVLRALLIRLDKQALEAEKVAAAAPPVPAPPQAPAPVE
jgi:small subunit ribosomal protein S6